jgi:hypothetical protein
VNMGIFGVKRGLPNSFCPTHCTCEKLTGAKLGKARVQRNPSYVPESSKRGISALRHDSSLGSDLGIFLARTPHECDG